MRASTPTVAQVRTALPIAIVGAVLVAFCVSPLPRITPDAAVYLTGAERLAEDGVFASCERAITEYAPGYSASLAVLVRGGFDSPDAARIVNVLATLALVLAAALLARGAGLGRRGVVAVAIAAAVAPVTLRNGAAAWSESLFSALLVSLLVVVVNSGHGFAVRLSARLALVVALSWALLLTRYSGLFALPAVVLAAWLGSRELSFRPFRVVLLAGATLAAPVLFYLRNLSHGTGAFGSRSPSEDSVAAVLMQVPDGLSSIVLPVDTPLVLRIAVVVPLVVAAAFALRPLRTAPLVLATLSACYVGGVTYAATRTRLDPVDARLLSPMLAPGAVLVALGAERARQAGGRLGSGLRAWAIAVVVLMAVLTPGVAWYLHDAERTVALDFPVSCADWPEEYEAEARSTFDRRAFHDR